MRVFALSDVHVDYPDNMTWLKGLDPMVFREDVLLVAGDATHQEPKLRDMFIILKSIFAEVFFVPGNHELWVMKGQGVTDSLAKFERILALCEEMDVRTRPCRLKNHDDQSVWVVPLYSWYTKPEEGTDSLFVNKPGEDASLSMWSDNYFVRWPALPDDLSPTDYFLRLNENAINRSYDAPVISLSHFLPRQELIFSFPRNQKNQEKKLDPNPSFNFSRVAGSRAIDEQIRVLGSKVHVYGHQHRNRCRDIDGVTYVSHCLGYGHEREKGHVRHINGVPKHIWTIGEGAPEGLRVSY